MNGAETYSPPFWLRSALLQTALASSKLRHLYCRGFEAQTERVVLDAGEGRKTTAYVNTHPNPQGMVVLLHGWLGRPQSTYTLSAAKTLFDSGFSTARVTLPEHAEAVLMNRQFIPITRHDFVREAMLDLCARNEGMPFGLLGFSLGGNMVLRIARDLNVAPVPQLKHVFAVSPAIDPNGTGETIDDSFIFRHYFMRKMDLLYRKKLELYPELTHLCSEILNEKTALGVTEAFVAQLPEYPDLEAYFDAYRIKPDDFVDCETAVTLITSDDDPIVSSDPARMLNHGPKLERVFTRFGGHNGFFDRFPASVHSEALAVERFKRSLKL